MTETETMCDDRVVTSDLVQVVGGKVFFAECESAEAARDTVDNVQQHINNNLASRGSEQTMATTILGLQSLHESAVTVKGYFLQLLRQHGLHKNEREMVLSEEDQLIALQLSLAEKNKQVTGDFDVEMSLVLEFNKKISLEKLGLRQMDAADAEYQEIKKEYSNYLTHSNLIDLMDVFYRIKEEIPRNEELSKHVTSTNFVLINTVTGTVETTMLKLLAEGKDVLHVRNEISLDESLPVGDPHFECSSLDVELCERPQFGSTPCLNTPCTPLVTGGPQASVSEVYAGRIFLAYVHLLVNSRNEIALARAINVPDRALDHQAFTDIKREAKKKNMPMFQLASSYIMRLRLGGRSYAPDPNSPLATHVKGIGEFTDLAHKLQTIIEEDMNSSSAVRRVFAVIKNLIVKSKDVCIRRESVETVATKLCNQAMQVLEVVEKSTTVSPCRAASTGASMVGRKTLRLLRSLLDHACTQPCPARAADVLTDAFSSQNTPIRFPSLLSQFRSPLEHSPDSKQDKSLAQRMQAKLSQQQKSKLIVPRYGAFMDWALPLHDAGIGNNQQNISITHIEEYIPSKTVAHQAAQSPKKSSVPSGRRVPETIRDQENVPHAVVDAESSTGGSTGCTAGKKGKKRMADSMLQNSQPCNKKVKKGQPKMNKKKMLPLQKGQKQLTAFFRV